MKTVAKPTSSAVPTTIPERSRPSMRWPEPSSISPPLLLLCKTLRLPTRAKAAAVPPNAAIVVPRRRCCPRSTTELRHSSGRPLCQPTLPKRQKSVLVGHRRQDRRNWLQPKHRFRLAESGGGLPEIACLQFRKTAWSPRLTSAADPRPRPAGPEPCLPPRRRAFRGLNFC